jgi:transcriptional regulator with XRE-family HTH domain
MPSPKSDKARLLLLESFGHEVRSRRRALGYSQEAFGDLCGIDRTYIGGIERGEHNLALVNVFRIIDALGLAPSEFFKGLDEFASTERPTPK